MSDAKRSNNRRRRRGRPKGSAVPIERDRQRFAVAACRGFLSCGAGPYISGYWAAVATGNEPIKLEDIEGLLTAARIDIKRTASSLDKHIDALVRKTKRTLPGGDPWLEASELAIKALILAARNKNIPAYCAMLDTLIALGWADVIARLSARIIEATKGNLPPFEDRLGRQGQRLLDQLRLATSKKA
jgi:hypothetical protein